MYIDTDQLENEYPPEPECRANEKECTFTPVSYLCHECGGKLCSNCAVGIRHQPQLFKYERIGAKKNESVQMHCPDCAASHSYDTTKLGAGIGGIVLGLLIYYLGGVGTVTLGLGTNLLVVGGFLLYNEHMLKQELDSGDIYATSTSDSRQQSRGERTDGVKQPSQPAQNQRRGQRTD